MNTIIVSAKEEIFWDVFMFKKFWHSIRIANDKANKIEWIAVYRGSPVSAITHVAKILLVERKPTGLYCLYFEDPFPLDFPIKNDSTGTLSIRGPRYADYCKLVKSKTLSEVI